MLSRLREAGSIRSFSLKSTAEQIFSEYVDREYERDGTLPSKEALPERYWKEFNNKDGSFHTKVIVSDENRDIGPGRYVNTKRFFNIITDSTGLITFEYGTRFFPHYKKVQPSVWGKDPNLLEEVLETAFKSPRTIRAKGEHRHEYNDSGRGT